MYKHGSLVNLLPVVIEYFFLFEDTRFSSIGPIYYEYGSMVITFDNSDSVIQAYDLLRVSFYEDKKLLGMKQSYSPDNFVYFSNLI